MPAGRIGSVEQNRLIEYLESGKALYIEGNDLYSSHRNIKLFSYFGVSLVGEGNRAITGNIDRIKGLDGTLAEGLNYAFPKWSEADEKPDIIAALRGSQQIISCQKDRGRAAAFTGEGKYRIITSSVIFGAIYSFKDGDSPHLLMNRYMDFLLSKP
jgi:hypothetical protein